MKLNFRKPVYIALGCTAVVLGTIGIFVPGLPTTPFLLLASWCFYNSSKKLHDRLNRSFLGKYLQRYNNKNGVSLRTKLASMVMMWSMISLSIFVFLEHFHTRIIVFVAGLIGTFCVLFLVPNQKKEIESKKVIVNKEDEKEIKQHVAAR
ncbi:MAG: YbaN family protein [Bacteroidales bacterium]